MDRDGRGMIGEPNEICGRVKKLFSWTWLQAQLAEVTLFYLCAAFSGGFVQHHRYELRYRRRAAGMHHALVCLGAAW